MTVGNDPPAASDGESCSARGERVPKQPPGGEAERGGAAAFTCTICGSAMFGVHCKLICANCGCREDCSDLFPV